MVDTVSGKNLGILNEQYQLVRLLGKGTTSRVYLSVRSKDGLQQAIKIFKPEFLNSGNEARQIFIDELTALASLEHPNIVKMYEYGIDGKIVSPSITLEGIWFIALEYISERTLVDLVQEQGGLSEEVTKYFFSQMIETLSYINSKGISHRDLKLENMLVSEDYQLKFADFGFASFSKDFQTQQKGTPIYVAPEIIAQQPYIGEEVDVFSLGVILFALMTGKYPFQYAHVSDQKYQLVIQKEYLKFWQLHDKDCYFSESAKDLLQQMLAYIPAERIKAADIADHDWLVEDPIITPEEAKKSILKKNNAHHHTRKVKERGMHEAKEGRFPQGDQAEEFKDFKVSTVLLRAYAHDRREAQLSDQATPSQIVDALQSLVKEKADIGKQWALSVKNKSEDPSRKSKTVTLNIESKGLNFKVNFIKYEQDEDQETETGFGLIYLRFEKKQGPALQFYKCIEKIRSKLKEDGLIE